MSARPEKTYSPSVALEFRGGRWSCSATREPRCSVSEPESGASSPERTRSSVDLPAPLRPDRVIRSPASSLKETSANSSLPPTWTSREVAVAIAIVSSVAILRNLLGMDGDRLRAIQGPLKEAYRESPEGAQVTLKASGSLGEGISCSVQTGRALAEAGLHP